MPSRAPKHCSSESCMNAALPGKRNCADCGNSRWPTDDPLLSMRSDRGEIQQAMVRVIVRDGTAANSNTSGSAPAKLTSWTTSSRTLRAATVLI
jgi:hypothetical protein